MRPIAFFMKKRNTERFFKSVSKAKFPKLKDVALKIYSMFGSTYMCENMFSSMQVVKSRNRNQKANQTLDNCLRLATTSINIDRETTVQCQRTLEHMHPIDRDLQ